MNKITTTKQYVSTEKHWSRDVIRVAFHFVNDAKMLVGGDVDRLHILLAFGLTRALNTTESVVPTPDAPYLNALSISQMTNITRETVRRKLKEMVSEGMMTHDADRGYALKDPDLVHHLAEPLFRLSGRNPQSNDGAE